MQNDLDIINDWCSEWLLFLNIIKCYFLHFGKKVQLSYKLKYYINGQILEKTSFEKDLGLFVTPESNWDKLVPSICSEADFRFKMISKCFLFKSIDLIRKLHTTLIRTKLEYANAIWYPTTNCNVGESSKKMY